MDGWKKWEGKRVFIKLKKGREYSGKVISVDNSHPDPFISIVDRYGKDVTFSVSEIKIIQEEVKNE